jgi:hypothetical protein
LELNTCALLPKSEAVAHLCAPLITTNPSLKVSDRLDIKKVASFPTGLLVGLSSLTLVPKTGQIGPFLEISRAARHTLLDLEWRLGWGMSRKSFSWFPCLSKFIFLQVSQTSSTLEVSPTCAPSPFVAQNTERLERLNDMLRTAAIDNEIKTITIIMAPITERNLYYFLNDFRWGILDSLLRGERFKNLRTFVLRLQWIKSKGLARFNLADISCEGVLERLKDRLPGLNEKNIISISHDEGVGTSYQ